MKFFLVMGVGLCVATGFASADTTEFSSDHKTHSSSLSLGQAEKRVALGEYGSGNKWYLVPNGGMNLVFDQSYRGVTISYDTGFSFGLGLGIEIKDNFRLQLDVGYMKNDVDPVSFDGALWWPNRPNLNGVQVTHSGDVSQLPIMFTGIFDLGSSDDIRPYVGFGIGTTRLRIHTVNSAVGLTDGVGTDTDWEFSYQAIAGIEFDLSPTSNMYIGYRYLNVESDKWKGDFENSTISIGIQYRF